MQGTSGMRRRVFAMFVASAIAATPAGGAAPLARDLSAYVVFGLRNVGLKNISVQGACNTGVNCPHPNTNSSCGVVSHEDAHYDAGSQIAGDRAQFNRGGAEIWQLFSNEPSGRANVAIGSLPIEPLGLPILGDVDRDGTPSCRADSGGCVVDAGDLAAACGFPTPFPSCDPSREVLVLAGVDCVRGPDAKPGNRRCDLVAGTYGSVSVQTGGKLALHGGSYAVCAIALGQNAEVIADAPTTLAVRGDVTISNESIFGPAPGQECGKIQVHAAGTGSVSFGRHVKVNGFFCGPERVFRLGHDNDLTGRFFGDIINSDGNNRALCCQAGSKTCEVPGPGAPLRRTLDAYFALAQRTAAIKDLQLDAPCNVGVNCAAVTENGSCGVLSMENATFATGSQVVGDRVYLRQAGARLWQLFRNGGGPIDNAELLAPPEMPFDPPVIPGTCSAACEPDVAALEAACGFPAAFPACDLARSVRGVPLADCAFDTTPGNQRCDLAPGVYGRLSVLRGARVVLAPGEYVFCGVKVGHGGTLLANAATVLLPIGTTFRASNDSQVGEDCGDLTVLLQGRGSVTLGRHVFVAARVCAPQASLRLGHGNTLIGQFVGDRISADASNQARCCCVP